MVQGQNLLNRAFIIIFALFMCLGMHYFQHNQGGYGLDLPVNAVSWCFISLLIGIGLWRISSTQQILYSPLTIACFVCFILLLLPIFYPNNDLAEFAYPRLLGFFAGFLLLFAMQQLNFNQQQVKWLLFFIVIAAVIESAISLTQMYLLNSNNWIGFNPNYGRPWGIFQQPNVLASFIATGLILSVYLLHSWRLAQQNKILKGFLYLNIFVSAWVIYICVSRTGYLGAIVALVLVTPWGLKKSLSRHLSILLLVITGASTHYFVSASETARSSEQLAQAGARALQYEQSWHMFTEKPWLGWGYGSFEKSFLTDRAERIVNEGVPFVIENLTHPHNEILYWAVEGGLIPVLGLFILAGAFLWQLKHLKVLHSLALISLVTPLLLHSQTEYPFYHSAASWAVFLVLIFTISHTVTQAQRLVFRPSFLVRANAILIPLLTSVFMVSAIHANYLLTKFERTGRTNLDLLMQVKNPLPVATRLEFNIFTLRMLVGEKLNKPEELQAFITWAERQLNVTPRANIYWNLAYALKLTGHSMKAQAVLDYAQYLYPNNQQLQQDLDKAARDINRPASEIKADDVPLAPMQMK